MKRMQLTKSMKHYATVCLLFLLLASGIAHASNDVLAQTVTANFNDVTLDEVIWELKKQTDFTFIYSTNDVQQVKVKSLNVEAEDVTEILDKCLHNSNLTYTIHNGVIAIRKAEKKTVSPPSAPQQQSPTIQGVVVDEAGEPLFGVNIVVKGTTRGAVTDLDGNFVLTLAENNPVTLQVTYIGFAAQEVRVNPGQSPRIIMKDDTEVLGEVIVTGYGTFKKSAFAGSATTVKMTDKENVPTTDFKTLIQGSAPGVQVNSTSGAVGGSSSITIRGMGSINASTSPLYVIDGIPAMASIEENIDGGTDFMATLNTSDIENITVIKDAAAASLYGSRAANGVVLITTKSGKEGKASFNVKADWGFSDYATDYRKTMSGQERRDVLHEGLVNQGLYMKNMSADEAMTYANENIDTYAPVPWNGWADWESALFRNKAPFQNYEFSAAGGDKKTSYYTSVAYTEQEGLVRQQDYNRITGRLNVKYQMTNRLQVGANILFSAMTQDGSSEGGTYTSPIYSTRHKVSASDPILNEDGSYNKELLANGYRNPKSALDYNYKRQKVKRSFNTVFGNYTFLDGLVFNTTFSLDHSLAHYKSWTDPRSTDGESDNGSLSENMYEYNQMVWKNNLTYITTFADKHHLDVLGGFETHQYKRHHLSSTVKDYPNVEKHEIGNGAKLTGFGGNSAGWRLVSYLARANYDYENKYYLGASVRLDASSRLFSDSRWGTFWSVSGAWRISSEPFMESLQEVLTNTKLRLSYGSNGNLPSDYYRYLDLTEFGKNYNGKPGFMEEQLGNKDLKWEKNYNLNLGLDFRLFDRVGMTLEYYNRKSSDLLLSMPISSTTGFTNMYMNIGRLKNEGVEFEINADILRGRNFNWNTALNFGHNKNTLVNLGDQQERITGAQINKVGSPFYQYYVKEFAGINPDNGRPQYYINGATGSREITEDVEKADYIVYKGPEPKLAGGWNNSFKYKMFDLSFLWTFTLGGYSYDRGAGKLEHGGKETAHNLQALYHDRWQKPGDVTNIEMVMVGNDYDMSVYANSRRVHSTDHLRLKNLTLGVSLPKKMIRSVGFENVRAYFSAVNLLTFAAYDGYDPEIPSNGDIYFEAPKMKTMTFGIDIKF